MIEKLQVFMTAFEQDRTISVYLPENYNKSSQRYPVLYMHDGQNVFEDERAINGVSLGLKDYLDQTGIELIVVAIDLNPEGEERINEYCPWANGKLSEKIFGYTSSSGGKGEEYLDFIVHELKPLIDTNYRTLGNHTAMAGISLGGLISTYAACRYPDIFKRIATLSPAFYRNQEEIEQQLRSSDLSAIEKFYMDFGTKELGENEEMNQLFLTLTNGVYEILNSKITNLHYQIIEDAEHHYLFFKKRIPEMLTYLFSESMAE